MLEGSKLSDLKTLMSAYDKHLKDCHNRSFSQGDGCLEYFVSYLRHMRDCRLLIYDDVDEATATLMAAVEEFDQHLAAKSNDEKEEHWRNFWEFVAEYINIWKVIND